MAWDDLLWESDEPRKAMIVGVDIGQKRDPTAICVVQTEQRDRPTNSRGTSSTDQHYLVRYLERMPVGASFPFVVERVARVVEDLHRHHHLRPDNIYVDATGLGPPIVDLFETAIPKCSIVGVYFTHGDRRADEDEGIRLGKAFLVSRLQLLLQTRRLHLPETDEAKLLAEDLLNYEIEVGEDANERYGAFRVGARDDLVTALGMAVQVEIFTGPWIS